MAQPESSPLSSPIDVSTQIVSTQFPNSSSNHSFGPKLGIKLQDNNFILGNQQVEGVILTHKLHKFVVNPQIPLMFKTESDCVSGIVSAECEQWISQDQALFIWLLSTISESVRPRVLACKRSYEVWDSIHKHFNAVMKARVRQLRTELKSTKKANRTVSEYVLRIKALADSLLAIRDVITEQDQIDDILDGLPEDYSPFVMHVYGSKDLDTLYDVEALLYVQEARLDKFKQELVVSTMSANVGKHQDSSFSQFRGNSQNFRGRGRTNRGRGGRSQGRGGSGSRPTCQLCGKYGHAVLDCWHRFDENFVPQNTNSTGEGTNGSNGSKTASAKGDSSTSAQASTSFATAMVATHHPFAFTHELTVPQDIESQAWFADSGI